MRRRSRPSIPRSVTSIKGTRIYSADIVKFAADTGLYRSFAASLFNFSDLFNTFQLYRITSLKLEYQLYNQLNNNSAFPTLYIAPQDWTETGTPSSINEVQTYRALQTFQFGPSRPVYSRTFVPYVNMTTSGPGRTPVRSPWLSTTSDAPPHMACVEWLQNYNSTSFATHTIRLVVTADFVMKGLR